MKALIIGQKVSLSVIDFVHGGGHYMHRILVPYADNLVFGISEDDVFAFVGYNLKKSKPDILMEIDVSEALVEKALILARAKEEFQKESTEIEKLLALAKKR